MKVNVFTTKRARLFTADELFGLAQKLWEYPHWATMKVENTAAPVLDASEVQQALQEFAHMSKDRQALQLLEIKNKQQNNVALTASEKIVVQHPSLVSKAVNAKARKYLVDVCDVRCPSLPGSVNMENVRMLQGRYLRVGEVSDELGTKLAIAFTGEFGFFEFFPTLAFEYTFFVYSESQLCADVLCQALAGALSKAKNEQHFVLAESAVDLKKIIGSGVLCKFVPLVTLGLSCNDKACNVDLAKALVDATGGVPAKMPRFVTTTCSPQTWVNFMAAKGGSHAVHLFARKTIWVGVHQQLVADQRSAGGDAVDTQDYVDYFNRNFGTSSTETARA